MFHENDDVESALGALRGATVPATPPRAALDAAKALVRNDSSPSRSFGPIDWRLRFRTVIRIAAAAVLAGVGTAGILGLWTSRNDSVFADVGERIRSARSLSMDVLLVRPGETNVSYHVDQDGPKYRRVGSHGRTVIDNGRAHLILDAVQESARLREVPHDDTRPPVEELLDIVEAWRERRTHDLGHETIGGRLVMGSRTILNDPGRASRTVEFWYDHETLLPVRINMRYEGSGTRVIYSNFAWNPALDESLFELTAPSGYKMIIEPCPASDSAPDAPQIQDPLVKDMIALGARLHWNDEGGRDNAPTPGVDPTAANVRAAYFTNCTLTDVELSRMREMTDLRFLVLADTAVTDADLAYLATLKNLRYLSLDRTHVTDAGLRTLGNMASLRQLDLRGTNVSDAAVEALKQTIPIVRR